MNIVKPPVVVIQSEIVNKPQEVILPNETISTSTVSTTVTTSNTNNNSVWNEVKSPMVQPTVTTAPIIEPTTTNDKNVKNEEIVKIDSKSIDKPVDSVIPPSTSTTAAALPVTTSIVTAKLNALHQKNLTNTTQNPIKKPAVPIITKTTTLVPTSTNTFKVVKESEDKAKKPIVPTTTVVPTTIPPVQLVNNKENEVKPTTNNTTNNNNTMSVKPNMTVKPPVPTQLINHNKPPAIITETKPPATVPPVKTNNSPTVSTTSTDKPSDGHVSSVSSIFGFLNPFNKSNPPTPSMVKNSPLVKQNNNSAQKKSAVSTLMTAKPITPPPPTTTTTTVAPVQPQQEDPQYEMDFNDNSDTDDDDRSKDDKFIPDWAKPNNLKEALARQFGLIPGVPPVDPDTIFTEVQTCSLEEIFKKNEGKMGKYSNRTSSARWDFDQLTLFRKKKI